MKYLYIDEGPYMSSLEHLIQHYMKFSDGLPINLRYPIAPKPKPPLPLFSTIPKSNRNKLSTTSPSDPSQPSEHSERKLSVENFSPTKRAQRNFSIPSDDLMNHVGILSTSPPTSNVLSSSVPSSVNDQQTSPNSGSSKKSPGKTTDILNFRSLKLPKKSIILDGMKSLKKSKAAKESNSKLKTISSSNSNINNSNSNNDRNNINNNNNSNNGSSNNNVDDATNQFQTNEEISQSLRNLTFSSDFKTSDMLLYNVPTNNGAVLNDEIRTMKATRKSDLNATDMFEEENFDSFNNDEFTRSDKIYFDSHALDDQDKDNVVEEIYFVDAPTKMLSIPSTSFNYIAFKQVPYFPDGTPITNDSNDNETTSNSDNNNNDSNSDSTNNNNICNRPERIQSTASSDSTENEFLLSLQSQKCSDSASLNLTNQQQVSIIEMCFCAFVFKLTSFSSIESTASTKLLYTSRQYQIGR